MALNYTPITTSTKTSKSHPNSTQPPVTSYPVGKRTSGLHLQASPSATRSEEARTFLFSSSTTLRSAASFTHPRRSTTLPTHGSMLRTPFGQSRSYVSRIQQGTPQTGPQATRKVLPSTAAAAASTHKSSHNMSGVIQFSGTANDFPAAFSGQQLDIIQQRSLARPQEGAPCSANPNDKTASPCSAPGFQCLSVRNCKANTQEQQCVRSCTAFLPASSKSTTSTFTQGCQCQFDPQKTVLVIQGSKKGQFHMEGYCPPAKDQCDTANRAGFNSPAGPPQFDGVGRGKGGSGGSEDFGRKILDGITV